MRGVGGVGERVRRVGGHVDGLPGPGGDGLSPERHPHLAVEDGEHLLEVVPVRGRPAAGRDVHVDEGVLAVGVLARHQDRVRVADQPDVRQGLVVVWPCDGELAGQVVGRYRSGLT